ncbi:MAG: signal peptidase I [Elusimicrobia bacterium]|nr:signal peptidase I [Elusimicrobiota bacterium]
MESSDGFFTSLIFLALAVFMLVCVWKVFVKAGKPGWASLIPIYNAYVLLKMAGKPSWWLLFLLIPLVNIVFGFLTMLALSERFGKGVGYALGLIFLPIIFYPILAFGEATYTPANVPV